MELRKLLLVEYIQEIKGHKNSKGENAPWVIKSHENDKIIASFSSKEKAKKHLKRMHAYGD